VKNERSTSSDELSTLPAGSAWTRFWFAANPTTGLHCLRLGSGLLILFWLLTLLGHQNSFLSQTGWLDSEALIETQDAQNKMMEAQNRILQREGSAFSLFGWSIYYLAGDNAAVFQTLFFASLAVILLFTLGIATRLTGVLTWVAVASCLSNTVSGYEGDFLLGILAFYLMIGYLFLGLWNGNLSTAERILGSNSHFVLRRWLFPASQRPQALSVAANFALRLLQIHVAILMVTSALHKLQMGDWWSGAALYYPLHPPLTTTFDTLQREIPNIVFILSVLSAVQYAAVAWQLAFPFFAWRRGWARFVLIGGGLLYWAGALLVFGLPVFGPFVLLGCLSYLTPEEWVALKERVLALRQSAVAKKSASEPKKLAV
jgi:hypothetical protein